MQRIRSKSLQLSTFQISHASEPGALRIGATRRPPRGVAKDRWQKDGYFDVWFPIVAPSAELLGKHRPAPDSDPKVWNRFFAAYRRELLKPPASHAVALLAALARQTPIAIGCYCADETRCHRSVLAEAIRRSAERLA